MLEDDGSVIVVVDDDVAAAVRTPSPSSSQIHSPPRCTQPSKRIRERRIGICDIGFDAMSL